MSLYLEIPQFNSQIPFKTFFNDGMVIAYPHWHKEIEFIYAKKNTVNIGVADQVIQISEREIFFFASGEPHYFLTSPDSERYVFQFDLKIFDETILRTKECSLIKLFEEGEPHSRNWPKELVECVEDLLIELYELKATRPVGSKYIMMSDVYRLIGELYQNLPKRAIKSDKGMGNAKIQFKSTLEQLDKVFEYVENHYQEPISLKEAATYVGFSSHYFTRFFKNNTGKTFMKFLTEYRVSQAKFILANEKLPMAEVAERAGFTSVKTFHHVFKEVVGKSPLKYQKALQNDK